MKNILIITGLLLSSISSTCIAQTHEPINVKVAGTISNNQPVHEALVTAPAPALQTNHDTHESIEAKSQQVTKQAVNVNQPKTQPVAKPRPANTNGLPGSTDDSKVTEVKNSGKVSSANGPGSVDDQVNMKTNTNKPLQPVVSGKSSVDD